jgi:hypothetical protein
MGNAGSSSTQEEKRISNSSDEALIAVFFESKGKQFPAVSGNSRPAIRHIFTIFKEIADFYCP